MHKHIHPRQDFVTIQPLDTITHVNGSRTEQGIVLGTGDLLCVGKIITNEAGEVWRIGEPGSIPNVAVLSVEPMLPIQIIQNALARQIDEWRPDTEHARNTILAALGHEAIQVQIF